MSRSKKIKLKGFKTPIWKLCGSDELRPVLQNVCIKDGFVYATDAHVAIKQSLDKFHGLDEESIANLEGKQIHYSVLKELDKYNIVLFKSDCIHAYTDEIIATFNYCKHEYMYPNVDSVIHIELKEKLGEVSFNPRNLVLLSQAMGSTSKTILSFTEVHKAIHVTVDDFTKEENLGILMPLMKN